MNHRFLRTTTTLVALCLSILFLSNGIVLAQAQPPVTDEEAPRSINVSGTGSINAQPDTAVVSLGVETQAEEAGAALTQNNEQMQALLDTLSEAGIAEEDIQTQTVRLQPQYAQAEPTAPQAGTRAVIPEIIGYVATNTVEVRVRELSTVGELLDAAVQAGGNQIQGIRFELSNPTDALDQARQAAWQDALHKAEQLATLADATLGAVLTISEFSQTPIPLAQDTAVLRGAAEAAVPVQPGTQQIQVNVQVTWRLVEAE
ncbi:MAG: SIMPL domain-containing protein [Caldilineaceae bacterium]